jgi:hypothetical protein
VEAAIKAEMVKRNKQPESQPAQTANLQDFLKLVHLRRALGVLYGESATTVKPEYDQVQLNLFGDILREAKATIAGWGGRLYFVYLPARDRYAEHQDYSKALVLSKVKDVDLPVLDLTESFSAQKDPIELFPFGRFAHYNEAGNRLVAKEVLRYIEPRSLH